jgi:nitrogen regulatory protein PII
VGWYLMVPPFYLRRRGESMKKVEAIIRSSKLDSVRDALAQIGVGDIAVEPYLSKLKIGVIVWDEITSQVVDTIEAVARQ